MALDAYVAATNRLLQNPVPASNPLFTTADLTVYINTARQQLAADAECVMGTGTLGLTLNVGSYLISQIAGFSAGGAALTGIQAALTVRQMAVVATGGATNYPMYGRPWEYFQRYYQNTGAGAATGQPKYWAQHARGLKGSFAVSPFPNAAFTIIAECALLPINLVTDATAEAIPYPWTDAIPYYAAYMGYLSSQRGPDADKMLARYKEFVLRGTELSTPTRFPDNFQGGRGARIAATKQPLTMLPGPPGRGGG